MTSKKSYKIEYYNLKSQIGKGNQMDWILNFKEKELGRPYYINQQTGEEVAAGSDIKLPHKRIFEEENGIDSLINETTSSLISTVNYRNVWEIKPIKELIYLANPMDWILNFKKEEDGRPYYINKEDEKKEIAAGSDKKLPHKRIFDEKNGILKLKNEKTGSLIGSVNFRNLWEIKPIEVVNLPLSEINVNIRQISGSDNGNELAKFIENNEKYDPDDFSFSVPNDWLGHGYAINTPGKIKDFVPNRFLLKGPRSRFMIVPMFYLENINSNKKLIGHIREYIKEIKFSMSPEEKEIKLEYLEEIIENNGNFWLAISRFDIMVIKEDNVIKAHINNAYGDHLKKGAGKIVTCFLVKYLKEIYPEDEIEVTLQVSGFSGTAWSRHGFERKEGVSSGGIESASHILNLEENERICNEALEEFDITEFLYYDLTTEARPLYWQPELKVNNF